MEFKDNSVSIMQDLERKSINFLEESMRAIAAESSNNSPVDSGQLAQSFNEDSFVAEKELTAYVGSTLEHAVYHEQGTGEYALEGKGRTGGWTYFDEKTGNFVHTKGVQPKRMLHRAFENKKEAVKRRAEEIFGE